MPLGPFEREVLLLIARNRNPDSFVGGATVLHQLEASESALELVRRLPLADAGCLYLNSVGEPAYADPESTEFDKLIRHFGSVKGAWPKIVGR